MCWDTKPASESVKGQKGHEAVLLSVIMEFSSSADAGGEIVGLMLGRHRLRKEPKVYVYVQNAERKRRKKAEVDQPKVDVETEV